MRKSFASLTALVLLCSSANSVLSATPPACPVPSQPHNNPLAVPVGTTENHSFVEQDDGGKLIGTWQAALADPLETTAHYLISWETLEPTQGKFDFTTLDLLLNTTPKNTKIAFSLKGGGRSPPWVSTLVPSVTLASSIHGKRCEQIVYPATFLPAYTALYMSAMAAIKAHLISTGDLSRLQYIENAAMVGRSDAELQVHTIGCKGSETNQQEAAAQVSIGYLPLVAQAEWLNQMKAIAALFPQVAYIGQNIVASESSAFPNVDSKGVYLGPNSPNAVPMLLPMAKAAYAALGARFYYQTDGLSLLPLQAIIGQVHALGMTVGQQNASFPCGTPDRTCTAPIIARVWANGHANGAIWVEWQTAWHALAPTVTH